MSAPIRNMVINGKPLNSDTVFNLICNERTRVPGSQAIHRVRMSSMHTAIGRIGTVYTHFFVTVQFLPHKNAAVVFLLLTFHRNYRAII